MLITVAAILFQRAATSSWIELTGSNETRYRVSPIGIAEFQRGDSESASECRWWPRLGNQQLCVINDAGGLQAMTWLRRAYPLTVVALWASVLALFLTALRIPRQAPFLGPAVAAALPVMSCVAMWSIWSAAPRALAVLEGLPVRMLPGGLGLMLVATALTAAAFLFLVISRR